MSKYVHITNETKLSHMAVLVRLKSPAVLVLRKSALPDDIGRSRSALFSQNKKNA